MYFQQISSINATKSKPVRNSRKRNFKKSKNVNSKKSKVPVEENVIDPAMVESLMKQVADLQQQISTLSSNTSSKKPSNNPGSKKKQNKAPRNYKQLVKNCGKWFLEKYTSALEKNNITIVTKITDARYNITLKKGSNSRKLSFVSTPGGMITYVGKKKSASKNGFSKNNFLQFIYSFFNENIDKAFNFKLSDPSITCNKKNYKGKKTAQSKESKISKEPQSKEQIGKTNPVEVKFDVESIDIEKFQKHCRNVIDEFIYIEDNYSPFTISEIKNNKPENVIATDEEFNIMFEETNVIKIRVYCTVLYINGKEYSNDSKSLDEFWGGFNKHIRIMCRCLSTFNKYVCDKIYVKSIPYYFGYDKYILSLQFYKNLEEIKELAFKVNLYINECKIVLFHGSDIVAYNLSGNEQCMRKSIERLLNTHVENYFESDSVKQFIKNCDDYDDEFNNFLDINIITADDMENMNAYDEEFEELERELEENS